MFWEEGGKSDIIHSLQNILAFPTNEPQQLCKFAMCRVVVVDLFGNLQADVWDRREVVFSRTGHVDNTGRCFIRGNGARGLQVVAEDGKDHQVSRVILRGLDLSTVGQLGLRWDSGLISADALFQSLRMIESSSCSRETGYAQASILKSSAAMEMYVLNVRLNYFPYVMNE